MLKTLFAPLAMKLAGGLIAVLIVLISVQSLRLAASERHSEKIAGQLAVANAMIEVQNRAVDRLKSESDRRLNESRRLLKVAQEDSRKLQSQSQRLRESASKPVDGPCVISDELRRAEGL